MDLPPKNGIDKLLTYAKVFNSLRLMKKLTYGTKLDFIDDNMKNCLEHGIISDECSNDPIWSEHNIVVQDLPKELEVYIEKANYDALAYDQPVKPKTYWDYGFKHVVLPIGWRLMKGCDCGRNINESAFTLYDSDKSIKIVAYFQVIDDQKTDLDRMMDFNDSVFDALEGGMNKNGDESLDQ